MLDYPVGQHSMQAGRMQVSAGLSQYDETAIYRSARLRREQREWRIMLIAYGEDSCDKTEARIFAASAVVGRQEDWDAFLPVWEKRNPIPFINYCASLRHEIIQNSCSADF